MNISSDLYKILEDEYLREQRTKANPPPNGMFGVWGWTNATKREFKEMMEKKNMRVEETVSKMMKVVVITGGFDPLHSGHLEYIKAAKQLGDYLVVGVNSDDWLVRKKDKYFLPLKERVAIITALKHVDWVVVIDDKDSTAIDAIDQTRSMFPKAKIIFANGGDRTKDNIPEMSCGDHNIEFAFGVGGDNKMNSSSWILRDWENKKTNDKENIQAVRQGSIAVS
jgi:D-beta-D-heptose 7-phosphate kinase/D-beta-D-heptose 1-phosphate adenosyltransferase